MRAYEALTAPVVEHYRALGRFAEVDGDRPIATIAAGIVAAVERLRHAWRNHRGGFVRVRTGFSSVRQGSGFKLKTVPVCWNPADLNDCGKNAELKPELRSWFSWLLY
jgi:hypothetical protein